jgi:hypothetical protein
VSQPLELRKGIEGWVAGCCPSPTTVLCRSAGREMTSQGRFASISLYLLCSINPIVLEKNDLYQSPGDNSCTVLKAWGCLRHLLGFLVVGLAESRTGRRLHLSERMKLSMQLVSFMVCGHAIARQNSAGYSHALPQQTWLNWFSQALVTTVLPRHLERRRACKMRCVRQQVKRSGSDHFFGGLQCIVALFLVIFMTSSIL